MMRDMSKNENPATESSRSGPGSTSSFERAARWVVIVLITSFLAWLVYLAAAAFLPRWWAQRMGERVDGSFATGVSWGLGQGFVFTALALVILIQVRRNFLAWWARLALILLALLVMMPNFMTLAVTVGSSKSAHAGQRIFDVNAPGFQWAALIGSLVAVLTVLTVAAVLYRLRHRRRQVADLKDQSRRTSEPPTP